MCVLSKMMTLFKNARQIRLKSLYRGFGKGNSSSSSLLSFSQKDAWSPRTLIEIEKHWAPRLKQCLDGRQANKPKKYVLSMFPYPSGRLHMGHVRVYAISDALNLYYRLRGHKVIHPMGFDSFGLPAENAAITHNLDPRTWTSANIDQMKSQMDQLNFNFDWNRQISTCDPSYYRWTQWLFVKLHQHGLTYLSRANVNWDPVDKTVLADEQVDEKGCSWRSGAKVEKRALKQWFLRTTDFSNSLLMGLEDPDLQNWRDVVKIQREWIGPCTGTMLRLELINLNELKDSCDKQLAVWTDSPELLQVAKFVVLDQEHVLNANSAFLEREFYSGKLECSVRVLKPHVLNPLSGEQMSIFVLDKNDFLPPKCIAYLGIPDINNEFKGSKDLSMALGFDTVDCIDTRDGKEYIKMPGNKFDGLERNEVRSEMLKLIPELKVGSGKLCSSKLKDWLISRQRYWGTPIPIIHCPQCGPVAVSEADLPVLLPELSSYKSTEEGESPLALAKDWVNVKCPCEKRLDARRETDTMDTFVDSSWYYLRYLDNTAEEQMMSMERAKEGLPVDVYIGGKEHAALHLYYARFISHFLHSIGVSPVKEPFRTLVTQGVVKAQSYRLRGKDGGRYVAPDDVEYNEQGKAFTKSSQLPLIVEWEKMSKSKLNGVDPQQVVEKFGSDTTRWLMLSDVSPSSERKWSEDSYNRVTNMQLKLYKLVCLAVSLPHEVLPAMDEKKYEEHQDQLWDSRNYYIKAVNHNFSLTRNLAIALARIQSLLNELWKVPGQVKRDSAIYQRCLGESIVMLTPIAPHFAAEMWEGFNQNSNRLVNDFVWDRDIFQQNWPELDKEYLLKLIVRRNEEPIATFKLDQTKLNKLTEEKALELCSQDLNVQRQVLSQSPTATAFKLFPNYEAILDFSVRMSEEELGERRNSKEYKRQKRARKIEQMAKKREVNE